MATRPANFVVACFKSDVRKQFTLLDVRFVRPPGKTMSSAFGPYAHTLFIYYTYTEENPRIFHLIFGSDGNQPEALEA